MPEKDIDIVLFSRVKKGDRLALNTLFTNYYQKLCAFALTYLGNTGEPEEVVADVFANLWKNREHLDIQKSFRSYIYITVKHACFALLGKQKLHFETIDGILEDTVAGPDTPEQTLELNELVAAIGHTVDSLPQRCRQIFIMSRYDGLKYKEIAEILSISEKTVENQLIKALAILRAQLDPGCDTISQRNAAIILS